MIALDQLTYEQFERHGLDLLERELGVDGLARFLRSNRSGPGAYTRDRDEWLKYSTLDQIKESIRKNRPHSGRLRSGETPSSRQYFGACAAIGKLF